MNITGLVNPFILTVPDKPAIIHKDRVYSFRELGQSCRFYVTHLQKLGIRPGDTVLVFVPMGYSLYPILLAVFAVGGIAVFVDAWADSKRLDSVCRAVQPKLLISIPLLFPLLLWSKTIRQIPFKMIPTSRGASGNSPIPVTDCFPEDTALITFTTGSTGPPKGANRTHGFLLSQHAVLKSHLNLSPYRSDAPTLPIFILNNLAQGITSVIPSINPSRPFKFNEKKVVNELKHHQVSTSVGSPVFFDRLAGYLLKYGDKLPIKKIFMGGAAIFPEQARKIRQGFEGCSIEIVYGSTEAEPVCSIPIDDYISLNTNCLNGLVVGKPISQIRCRIIQWSTGPIVFLNEEEFNRDILPTNNVGEIIVSGDHVLTGYFQNPEADSENKIHIGSVVWHRTGDCGYLNESGELVLTGRCKQRIQTRDGYVDAFLVEGWVSRLGGLGTLISREEKLILVTDFGDDRLVDEVKSAFPVLKNQKIGFEKWKRIPRDSRHHSKIDYSRLVTPKIW